MSASKLKHHQQACVLDHEAPLPLFSAQTRLDISVSALCSEAEPQPTSWCMRTQSLSSLESLASEEAI